MTETDHAGGLTSPERRNSDRKKLVVDVRFEGGDATGIANTRDIGSGGLYLATGAALAAGTRVLMVLSLGGRELALAGTVVRADPGRGVGVRFEDVAAEDASFLKSELGLV